MKEKIHLRDETATITAAENLASSLDKGSLILLYGDLGAGKTTFARAFIRRRCQAPEMAVPSPTFTLVQEYQAQDERLLHMDLYRLDDPDALDEIGWEEALSRDVTALIEWPDIIPNPPTDAIKCRIDNDGAGRLLTIERVAP